eukprot:TRINITY_DN94516_c0_g1_i1.p1 TRINITY_DN94516_c0_g1~~TRINITY_DN94516_c0_g1_i1.p1  ORF type:complete len:220 (+),score=23.67 TRINITY_DN94516_c0_g1_i1:60-662(+)
MASVWTSWGRLMLMGVSLCLVGHVLGIFIVILPNRPLMGVIVILTFSLPVLCCWIDRSGLLRSSPASDEYFPWACVTFEDYLRLITHFGASAEDFNALMASGSLDMTGHQAPQDAEPQLIEASVPPFECFPQGCERTCVFCLDDMDMQERVCLLPCRHVFHAQCMADWRVHARGSRGLPYNCPVCRMPLDKATDSPSLGV